jgi:hypothetical protein
MLVAHPELRDAQEANAHLSMRLHFVEEDDGLSLMRWSDRPVRLGLLGGR